MLCGGQGTLALRSHTGTLQTSSPGKELVLRSHSIPACFCDAQGMVEVKLNSLSAGLCPRWPCRPGRWPLRGSSVAHAASRSLESVSPSAGRGGRRDRTVVAQGMLGVGVGSQRGGVRLGVPT